MIPFIHTFDSLRSRRLRTRDYMALQLPEAKWRKEVICRGFGN